MNHSNHNIITCVSGSSMAVWVGCYASQVDSMVVMASPAVNGYHSIVTYSWKKDGNDMPGEDTPLLFTNKTGKFQCCIRGETVTYTSEFIVSSKL